MVGRVGVTMHNQLHNELDQLEDLRGRSKAIVESVIAENITKALEVTQGDVRKTMELLALLVEEELSALTSEAFATGMAFARQRRAV